MNASSVSADVFPKQVILYIYFLSKCFSVFAIIYKQTKNKAITTSQIVDNTESNEIYNTFHGPLSHPGMDRWEILILVLICNVNQQ